jgi:hypothetical protein
MDFRFINGVNIQQIATAIFDVQRKDNIKDLPNNSIIWCKTDFLNELFDELKTSNKKYVLFTHCSDYEINEEKFTSRPSCVKKWFAQNVNYKHQDLIPYPIGVENHFGPNKGTCINTKYLQTLDDKVYNVSNKIINLLYSNFNPQTNRKRFEVLQTLLSNGIAQHVTTKNYVDYFEDLKQFLFIASPRGNGIDCHRTWEALYVGSLPIVDRHFMFDSYRNLPFIQIDSWDEVTPKFLKPYIFKYKNKQYFNNNEVLHITYWLNEIKNTAIRL